MNAPSAYQTYVETAITVSDPLELTRMLYRAAIESIQRSRQALSSGDIRTRAAQIGRAQQIIAELVAALNGEAAPELSRRLGVLYEYVLHLLQIGNFEQRQEPLAEAQKLMETLLEGWRTCESQENSLSGVTAA